MIGNDEILVGLVAMVPGASSRWHVRVDDAVGRCSHATGPCRQFAACESGPPIVLVVSRRLLAASPERFAGVLAHEIGHALLFEQGRFEHTEREADAVAEKVLGVRIRYDDEDVQTVGARGARPRPTRLG